MEKKKLMAKDECCWEIVLTLMGIKVPSK